MLLTIANYGRRAVQTSPDKWWRVQHFLRLSANYRGRKRNCYKIAYRYVHKALQYATSGRQLKKIQFQQLFAIRLEAAAQEHGLSGRNFLEGLSMSNVLLDKKVLTDIAIYEPRTFKSLAEISRMKLESQSLGQLTDEVHDRYPQRIFTRGML